MGVGMIARVVVLTADSSDTPVLVATTVIFLFVGCYLVYDGFGAWQRKQAIEETSTETVSSVTAGRTQLDGVAKPNQTVLAAPFTGEACLAIEWEVEWYDSTGRDSGWKTIGQGVRAVPFLLDDGTGEILVTGQDGDPTFEISDENTTVIRVESDETAPREIQRFIEAHDREREETSLFESPVADTSDPIAGRTLGAGTNELRRYTQSILPVESDAYVLGTAVERENADGDDDHANADGDDDHANADGDDERETRFEVTSTEDPRKSDRFIVSDHEKADLHRQYGSAAAMKILAGGLICLVCLAVLLGMF